MAVADAGLTRAPVKRRTPVLIGLALAAVLGCGGFYATWSGMVLGPQDHAVAMAPVAGVAFVPLDTIVVSLGPEAGSDHLRFSAAIEVSDTAVQDVEVLRPRILDVLNGYLRAIDSASIEDPQAMARLRAQMLRRVQMVTGEGRVRDLLITEFILN